MSMSNALNIAIPASTAPASPPGARFPSVHAPPIERIQRRRVKGWRQPPNTLFVGRPTRWGNPYSVEAHGRSKAVALFRERFLMGNLDIKPADARAAMAGYRRLSCWCGLDEECHADVYILAQLCGRCWDWHRGDGDGGDSGCEFMPIEDALRLAASGLARMMGAVRQWLDRLPPLALSAAAIKTGGELTMVDRIEGEGAGSGDHANGDSENEPLLVIDEAMLIEALADEDYTLPADAGDRALMLGFIGNNLVEGYSQMVLDEARDQAMECIDGTLDYGKGKDKGGGQGASDKSDIDIPRHRHPRDA